MKLTTADKHAVPQAVLDYYAPIWERECQDLIDKIDAFLELRIQAEFDELREDIERILARPTNDLGVDSEEDLRDLIKQHVELCFEKRQHEEVKAAAAQKAIDKKIHDDWFKHLALLAPKRDA